MRETADVGSAVYGAFSSLTDDGSIPLCQVSTRVEIAELRIRGLAPRAVDTLEELVTSADSEQVRLQAANSLVDRSVGRATERIQVAAQVVVKRPW